MNNEAMKEVLNELFSHLERLETQNEAILQFLKEKKRVTDKQLAPYLEQAGNASNVKWRATRVRIDHLLEPEHPEEEIKLGKRPELHDDSANADSSEDKRPESVDKENKRGEPSDKDGKHTESRNAEVSGIDLSKKEKPAPAEAVLSHPIDGNADKPEVESKSNQRNKELAGQDQRDEKSDSVHHPTEMTEPLARQEGAEPAAQLGSKDKDDDQEAA